MAIGTAFRAFFGSLFDSETSARVQQALEGKLAIDSAPTPAKLPAPEGKSAPQPKPPTRPARSEAVTLLATLQREARLVDLLQENLDQFSDAQVGAAARPCLQQCAATLDRVLSLTSIVEASEGSTVEAPESASPAAYQWIGEGAGRSGTLVHHGWQATRVELPAWTGRDEDALVIAPAQLKR